MAWGSSPQFSAKYVLVAEWKKASDCKPDIYGFDPCLALQL